MRNMPQFIRQQLICRFIKDDITYSSESFHLFAKDPLPFMINHGKICAMNVLHLTKLAFTAEVIADSFLPPYLGNSLRGAFGYSLSRRNCIESSTDCEHCGTTCIYADIFKSQSYGAGMDSVPNPFVIGADYQTKEEWRIGETLDFTITLFGHAASWREEIVAAVGEMFAGKLACLRLKETREILSCEWTDEGEIPYIDTLTIKLKTPLVLLASKQLVNSIDFSLFADSVFNRIAGVVDVYGEQEFVLPYSLTHRKPNIVAESKLNIVTIKQEKQPIKGLLGELRFFGDVTRYMPYVDLCSHLHIGKMTTRGCGRFEYEIGALE